MKQLLTLFTALLLMTSTGYSIAGFGLHLDQGFFTVDETTTDLEVASQKVGSITHHGFSNGYGIGGYLYVDAIPMVDIDLEAVMHLAPYDFSFTNQGTGTGISNQQFGWADFAMYATLQKKLFKLSIPLLAKAKLSAGAGLNTHSAIPMIDQKMLESVMGAGNLSEGTLDTDKLKDYLQDNKVSSTGFHIQTGVQFKLLMLDSFLYYRQVFAKDVIPDASSFGSLNLRVGMGF